MGAFQFALFAPLLAGALIAGHSLFLKSHCRSAFFKRTIIRELNRTSGGESSNFYRAIGNECKQPPPAIFFRLPSGIDYES